jgi:hypothetical protein
MGSIVLIDDDADQLNALEARLRSLLPGDVTVETWAPIGSDVPRERWQRLINPETVLVVTDRELGGKGLAGFHGLTVVSWCQEQAVPVGDFSRRIDEVRGEPDLFEIRVPPDTEAAAPYIAIIYGGFDAVRRGTREALRDETTKSPASVLAHILQRPDLGPALSLYTSRLGAANAALIDMLRRLREKRDVITDDREKLTAYVVAHVLLNGVLRYPGPILSGRALTAYCGAGPESMPTLAEYFGEAKYAGPFADTDNYFWRSDVDRALALAADTVSIESETSGGFNRAVLEATLGNRLASFSCSRCHGTNGGYYCPFTDRPVCERADCSVAANSWIPAGATVCRVEREYFDEWAPLLGL